MGTTGTSGQFVWTGELVSWMPVDVLKADEGATFGLAGILERPRMELHVGVAVEQDVDLEIGRPFQTFSRLATDRCSNSSWRTRYSRYLRVLTARWPTGSAPASIPSSEHRSTFRR
jgi:hypothetical protein